MSRKLLIGSALFGLVMAALFAALSRMHGRHWFDSILWIGYLGGAFVSGSLASPNEPAIWITLWFVFAASGLVVATLVRYVKKRPFQGRPT